MRHRLGGVVRAAGETALVRRSLVAAVALGTVVYGVSVPGALTDLEVYRTGGASWLHGTPLYTDAFPFWLPFTYPPVSAVLFGVLAVLPFVVAAMLLAVAGLVALSVTTASAVPPVSARAVATLAVVCGPVLEPVRTTLMFGQVNLVLMGLVAADCLVAGTRHPRGMLVGLAAAVKLTPLVFVLFFVARRQFRPAVTAVVTFAAATGAGMLFAPADSARYWWTTVFDPGRIGGAEFATNQSLRAALTRLDLTEAWLPLVAVVLVLAWLGARRASDPVPALLVVAAAGLLVSPVSWSHHWVWIAPALAYFAVHAHRNRAVLVATAVVFVAGQRFLPHGRGRELAWTWWQHLLGNSYLLAALTFLAWSALMSRPGGSNARLADRVRAGSAALDRPMKGGGR
ncbi:glycosyltransferase 87 family protein [Actinophytocola sp.]|uniref:glycosyltransferase 87 family protein n=1 Tax=Actinophytocola sp. TaxID=1872138 RepID=UPI002D75301E|nr:glycosyltransferase 87 family protein [Actinophytocola sp.]HYQ66884.1 glycosyltransferase 87 family protein [Actinophytocola sp.]